MTILGYLEVGFVVAEQECGCASAETIRVGDLDHVRAMLLRVHDRDRRVWHNAVQQCAPSQFLEAGLRARPPVPYGRRPDHRAARRWAKDSAGRLCIPQIERPGA